MSELLVPVLLGALWLAGVRRHPRWPPRRTALALAGLAALAGAIVLGPAADGRLSDHVVEHGLLTMVAAPLLAAAAPVRLALGTLPRRERRALARVLGGRLGHVLARPAVGLALLVAAMAGGHLPVVVDAASSSGPVHAVEHAALLWAAFAFWVPVVGVEPLPRRAGAVTRVSAVVLAMTAMAALGAVIATAGAPLYAGYPDLADQRWAGGLLWEGGMVVGIPAVLACAWAALSGEERRQRARELHGSTT